MSIIDRQELLEHLGGDLDLLEDAFGLFCDECRSTQAILHSALKDGDITTVRSAAHTLKGMASNFLAYTVCETAQQVHSLDAQALPTAGPLIGELNRQLMEAQTELQQIITESRDARPEH